MADQDEETGGVDPRPEEMDTGAQTGMAQVAIPDDASGKPLESIGGSATTTAPEPTVTTDAGKSASVTKAEVGDVVMNYGGDDRATKSAIIDVSTGMKSLVNTTAMVDKSATQSPDMMTGAQVAHDNAVQSFAKRFVALCEKVGSEIAHKIKDELAELHDAEDAVKKALKTAGVTG